MKSNGFGGGNTITGLNFEKETDILDLLKTKTGYLVRGNTIFYKKKKLLEAIENTLCIGFLMHKGLTTKKY